MHVSLSPYVSFPEFDFVAAQNISFNGNVSFDGLAGRMGSLIAADQTAGRPTNQADVANFQIESPTFAYNVSIVNNNGNTYFATGTAACCSTIVH